MNPCQETIPTSHPICNTKQVCNVQSLEEGDLLKYVKELEGKGKKPTELLHLLQITVDTDEAKEQSF